MMIPQRIEQIRVKAKLFRRLIQFSSKLYHLVCIIPTWIHSTGLCLQSLAPLSAACRAEEVYDEPKKKLACFFSVIYLGNELNLSKNCHFLPLDKCNVFN